MDKKGAGSKKTGVTRRQFLIGLGMAATGGLLSLWEKFWRPLSGARADGLALTPQAYLPHISRNYTPPTPTPTSTPAPTPTLTPTPSPSPTLTPTPTPLGDKPRVVRVHDPQVTFWDFESKPGWYGDYVDLARVEAMMVQGLAALTGTSTASEAWAQILPNYTTGQIIAVKISLNNATACDDTGNEIDALPQTLIALVKTLTEDAGVAQSDIWFYDTTKRNNRYVPTRLSGPVWDLYPNVHFVGRGECGDTEIAYDTTDDDLKVVMSDPGGNLQPRWLTPLLKSATYLINMPLFKYHGIHPVSLGFKNHFGSINYVLGVSPDDLHAYINPDDDLYRSDYSPLVQIYCHPYIKDKTVLTIGDALFGAYGATVAPTSWVTFGNDSPNSLFFARDPVALDCVLLDFIRIEDPPVPGARYLNDAAYDYLFLAQSTGLGVCEGTPSEPGGDPWETGYTSIDYLLIEM